MRIYKKFKNYCMKGHHLLEQVVFFSVYVITISLISASDTTGYNVYIKKNKVTMAALVCYSFYFLYNVRFLEQQFLYCLEQ